MRAGLHTEKKRLGEVLFELNFARKTQVNKVLDEQRRLGPFKKFRIGELLVFSSVINRAQLEAALRKQGKYSNDEEDSVVARHAARAAMKALVARQKYKRSLWDRLEGHLAHSPVLRFFKAFTSF